MFRRLRSHDCASGAFERECAGSRAFCRGGVADGAWKRLPLCGKPPALVQLTTPIALAQCLRRYVRFANWRTLRENGSIWD